MPVTRLPIYRQITEILTERAGLPVRWGDYFIMNVNIRKFAVHRPTFSTPKNGCPPSLSDSGFSSTMNSTSSSGAEYQGYAEKAIVLVTKAQTPRECVPVHTHAATAVHVHHHHQQPTCQVVPQQGCQTMSPASCQMQAAPVANVVPYHLAGPGASNCFDKVQFMDRVNQDLEHEHILLTDEQAKAIWEAQNGIISVEGKQQDGKGSKRRNRRGRKEGGKPKSGAGRLTEDLRRRWRRAGNVHSFPTENTTSSSDEESCTISAFRKGKDAYKK